MESYYRQAMAEGFFHADPHPGNMKWWNDKIYLLDLGMVGEVDEQVRELVLLLLLAFSQQDASFLSQVVLMLTDNAQTGIADSSALESDLAGLIERYCRLSLREIQLGPLLQEVTLIAVRHNVRLPASLTLMGKAFAQMQLVAAELDPTLDPFAVAESFVMKNTVGQVARALDVKSLFYEAQKTKARLTRVLEAVEAVVGARPGAKLQVDFKGTEVEAAVAQAGRRLSLAVTLLGAFIGIAVTGNSERSPRWLSAAMGGVGSLFAGGLLLDLMKPRRPK